MSRKDKRPKRQKHSDGKAESAEKSSAATIEGAPEVSPQTKEKNAAAGTGPEREIAELKERLQRLGADYQNYQKRAYKQTEQATQIARESLIKLLLPVLDNFEHSLENLHDLEQGGETQGTGALLKGIQIVHDHLLDALAGAGMQRIEVKKGDPFDPELHEAMLHEESDEFSEMAVLRELARGYQMNGRTLRPAKVSVAKAPANPPAEDQQADQKQETTEE